MTFENIFDTYYRKLYKLCLYHLRDPQEAEDVLQDVFLKVMKKYSTFKGDSSLYTWLYRIAVNTLHNYIKRKKIVAFISLENPKGVDYHDDTTLETNDDPAMRLEEQQEKQLRLDKLKICMEGLSKREKTAVYLYHYENVKQKEIAEIMGASVSAIEALLHKGRKKLKKCLQLEFDGNSRDYR